MDPLTLIGAIAASAQLAQQSFEIAQYIRRAFKDISNAPELVKNRLQQVQQLIQASEIIQNTPILQTDQVAIVLCTCCDKAEAVRSKLTTLLPDINDKGWQKLRKSVTAFWDKEDLVALFDDLEREKSTLMLLLQAIQPTILTAIKNAVSKVGNTLVEFGEGLDNIEDAVSGVQEGLYHVSDKIGTVGRSTADISEKLSAMESMMQKLQVQQQAAADVGVEVAGAYDIPPRRIRDFVGREEILKKLYLTLPTPESSNPLIVVIRGIGGQGKTQLTLEFCRRAKEKRLYSAIFWTDASSEITATKSFESFHEKMTGYGRSFLEPERKVEFVRDTLASLDGDTSWLLIFDNYDDPITFQDIQNFFPDGGKGTILITTRHADTDELADEGWIIELPGLEPADGIALLLKQSQVKSPNAKAEASAIVERLGNHALAIAQAGSYIKKLRDDSKRRIELGQFLDHFNRSKELILQETPRMSLYRRKLNDTEKETSLSVFTTWELSFQQLKHNDLDDSRERVLTLLAFFDYKDVSENLFQLYCNAGYVTPLGEEMLGSCITATPRNEDSDSNSPGGSDVDSDFARDTTKNESDHRAGDIGKGLLERYFIIPESDYAWESGSFGDILNDLKQLSLIQTFDAKDEFYHVSLHPLVNDWIKIRIRDTGLRYKYFQLSINILRNIIADILEVKDWPEEYADTLPARQVAVANLSAVQRNLKELPDIWDWMINQRDASVMKGFEEFSEFLWHIGKWREAVTWRRLIIKSFEEIQGRGDYQTLRKYADLAEMLYIAEEFDEAQKIASDLMVRHWEHPDSAAMIRTILASSLAHKGESEEALKVLRSTIKAMDENPREKDLGTALSNLGSIFLKLKQDEEAAAILKRARGIQLDRFGPHHQNSMDTDNNYVVALTHLGQTEEAEKIGIDVLERSQKLNGIDHTSTIQFVDTLAGLYFAQGRYAEAKIYCQQALTWREAYFGPKNFFTIESRNLMGKIEKIQNSKEGGA